MDYTVEIYLAMTALDVEDKLLNEKMAALIQLCALIKSYESESYQAALIQAIAARKTAFICEAATKKDLKEIFKPPQIHYDHNKIHPIGKYHIPEEELIYWSVTSLKAPLARHGFERYMEVFAQVFPGVELT